MKHMYAIAVAAAMTLAAATTPAQEHQHSGPQAAANGASGDGKGGIGMMSDTMQEHMRTMREQMEKIRAAADPGERDKLVQEHMRSMHAAMEMMRGMGGSMTQGPQSGPGAMGGDAQNQRDMMAQCMDMMQKMRPAPSGGPTQP